MIKRPQNLLRFAILGLTVGILVGYGLGRMGSGFADETDDIRAVLASQEAAWNAGDIPGFMEGYARDDLRFASGGDITTGWQPTLDRYLARYSDAAKMGELQFDILEVEQLSANDALVFGRWKLVRAADTPNGLFTLRFSKLDGEWKVVSDHTSSAD